MSFNIQALKNAARKAGHVLSEAEHLVASEMRALETFAHFHFGMSPRDLHYGMAYPSTLPEGFPGKAPTDGATDADAAPVEQAVAQVQTEAPAAAPVDETVINTGNVGTGDVTLTQEDVKSEVTEQPATEQAPVVESTDSATPNVIEQTTEETHEVVDASTSVSADTDAHAGAEESATVDANADSQ